MKRDLPTGVTAAGWFVAVTGALEVIYGIMGASEMLANFAKFFGNELSVSAYKFPVLLYIIWTVSLLLGIASTVSGAGILLLKNWGREMLLYIICPSYIAIFFIYIIKTFPSYVMWVIPGVLVLLPAVIFICYFSRDEIKDHFVYDLLPENIS